MSACGFSLDNGLPGALKKFAFENRFPLSATFELTPLCNFSCVMCYVHLTKEQMKSRGEMLTAEQWIDIAKQAKDMGTLYVTLTGGEPFVRPDFWDIYSELNKMGFLISVLSNGSLIDESVMEKFNEYGKPYLMKLSLYGASNETYSKVCGCPDGFERVEKAVKLIKNAGIPLMLTGTVVRENSEDLNKLYEKAREWNVPFQHTVTVVKSARGAVNSAAESRFTFDEFLDEMTLEKLEKNKFPPLKSPFAWCSSYGCSFWLTWNGHVQLCSFMNGPYATLENGLTDAWTELNFKLDNLKSPQECKECRYAEFCQRCPGMLCGESGDAEKISEDICNIAKKLYYAHKKLIQEEQT